MDRSAQTVEDHSQMARHLRPVNDTPEEVTYVVARSAHVRPGTPFVVAACVDDAALELLVMTGHESYSAGHMRRRPELRQALTAWEADDHELHRTERRARDARQAGRPGGPRRGLHPSLLGKIAP
jgi:hypothetical protein